MNLVRKMAALLILVGGLTQQTFGYFENFTKLMMANIKDPVSIASQVGNFAGVGICALESKLFPLKDGEVLKQKARDKFDQNKGRRFEELYSILDAKSTSINWDVNAKFEIKEFHSLTLDKTCITKFTGSEKHRYPNDNPTLLNAQIVDQQVVLTRSWPRVFMLCSLTSSIGYFIGHKFFKKN